MIFPRPSRVPTIRLVALAIAASAAAMVGLGSAAAHAAPTTAAPTTAAPATAAPATAATTTATTTAPTTASQTAAASSSTPATFGSSPSSTVAPGPPCAGQSAVLTPVLCIPTGFGEDQPAPVGTDGFIEFAGQVVNNGPAVADATVVITLPAALRLDTGEEEDAVTRYENWWTDDSDDDGTGLVCTTNSDGSVVTCATGAIAAGANFLVAVDLDAQDNAVVGTSADFTVALQSTPDPGIFPTTSVQATVDYVGTAHLQVTLTPVKATVVLGKSLTITATVHNAGPNQAVEAAAVGLVFPDDFSDNYPFLITNSQPFPGGISDDPAFALRTLATRRSPATAAAPAPSPIGFWPIGTIATGATVTVTIVVKAVKVGQVDLDFDASSADESCDDGDPSCENDATAALTAVAPATTTVPSTTATASPATATTAPSVSVTTVTVTASAGSAVATLPNTGFQPAPWVGSAAAAILLGGGLILLGAPRRKVRGRHR